jgi:hypothetical protein
MNKKIETALIGVLVLFVAILAVMIIRRSTPPPSPPYTAVKHNPTPTKTAKPEGLGSQINPFE